MKINYMRDKDQLCTEIFVDYGDADKKLDSQRKECRTIR